jgi:serine/threonine protein kinase
MYTPDFASPEQARGENAGTATDFYGLGGVLYHLLTGHTPHQTEGMSPTAIQRAICVQEPRRSSLWNAELKGDLDNILLKAPHSDAQRRYANVREFAATSKAIWPPGGGGDSGQLELPERAIRAAQPGGLDCGGDGTDGDRGRRR